jgi:hypothetical protein
LDSREEDSRHRVVGHAILGLFAIGPGKISVC